MKHFTGFLALLGLLAACGGEEFPDAGGNGAYFPLQKGIFQVYTVHEVRYSASDDPMQLDYEILAEVVDSFPSGGNQYTYVIHRSKRETEADEWLALDTWSARKDEREILVAEGNVTFVKMRFPLSPYHVWDGNVYNTMGEDAYTFTRLHQAADFNGMTFEKTLTVEQEVNDDPIVFRDERAEVYAINVGLVYKKVIQLNYCTADACLGQQKIDHGSEMEMVIKEYGKR